MKEIVKPRVRKDSKYSESFRIALVTDIVNNKIPYEKAAFKYGVNKGTISRWYHQYLPILDALRSDFMSERKSRIKKDKSKDKLCELAEKLERANLQIKALEVMIDIAEENYQIEIRKKSGAKR